MALLAAALLAAALLVQRGSGMCERAAVESARVRGRGGQESSLARVCWRRGAGEVRRLIATHLDLKRRRDFFLFTESTKKASVLTSDVTCESVVRSFKHALGKASANVK